MKQFIKINNCFLNDVAWGKFSSCDFLAGNHVDIWGIKTNKNLSFQNNFFALLNPEELARAGRYLHQHDRERFIISRGLLRIILGKYLTIRPAAIEFAKGENKKPFVKNTPLFYNVSHSRDQIVIAVSPSEIGVDVEFINPYFDFQEVTDEYFSADEVNFIEQKHSIQRFFMLWTRKEAITKATGKGLDNNLKYVPCLDGIQTADSSLLSAVADLHVSTFFVNEQYLASVAITDNIPIINFWAIDSPPHG